MITTGRETHPLIPALTSEQESALPRDYVARFYESRRDALLQEQADPLRYGFEPDIWKLADARVANLRRRFPTGVLTELDLGGNRASKTERRAKRMVQNMVQNPGWRAWALQSNQTSSRQNQQSIIYKYLPPEWKPASGKLRQGAVAKIVYSQAGGFTEDVLVCPNGSECRFKFYGMDVGGVEGAELNEAWGDELITPDWIEALIFRLVTRNGLLGITFTPIEGYSATVKAYLDGATTLQEVEAELLPLRKMQFEICPQISQMDADSIINNLPVPVLADSEMSASSSKHEAWESTKPAGSCETGEVTDNSRGGQNPFSGRFERVPRVQENLQAVINGQRSRAVIVYFHTADNPYGNYPSMKETLVGASREKILTRAYGVPLKAANSQLNFTDTVHILAMNRFAAIKEAYSHGPRYQLIDPCSGRNWFMVWLYFPRPKLCIAYREWPSHGHANAFIPGIGDPGPWAVPGKAIDGEKGPAQTPFKFGLDRYKEEILRVENGETIAERWMDCRYGNSAVTQREGTTTLIEQMSELGMDFVAMTGEKNILGANDGSIDMINSALAHDEAVPIGQFSPQRGAINEPEFLVTEECPNLIYALQNWTGKDGQHGACKDPIDCLRGAFLSRLGYYDEKMMTPRQPWLAQQWR